MTIVTSTSSAFTGKFIIFLHSNYRSCNSLSTFTPFPMIILKGKRGVKIDRPMYTIRKRRFTHATSRYGQASDVQDFKDHIEETRKLASGRPIWVTEFFAKGTNGEVKKFFEQILPWMDASDDIHRYAYFMAAPGLLLQADGKSRSDLGTLYNYNFTVAHTAAASSTGDDEHKRPADPTFKPRNAKRGADKRTLNPYSTYLQRDASALKPNNGGPECECCWFLRCRRCPQCRPGSTSWTAPPNTDKREVQLMTVEHELDAKGCRFVLWAWVCDAAVDISSVSTVTKHELASQGCRFVLWGWVCDKQITTDEMPTLVTSVVSRITQNALEADGCRFVLWGWICDKTFDIEASTVPRESLDELRSKNCHFVSHGWSCSFGTTDTALMRPTIVDMPHHARRAIQAREDAAEPTGTTGENSVSDVATIKLNAIEDAARCCCWRRWFTRWVYIACNCAQTGAQSMSAAPAPPIVEKRQEDPISHQEDGGADPTKKRCCFFHWCGNCKRDVSTANVTVVEREETPAISPDMNATKKCCKSYRCWTCKPHELAAMEKREDTNADAQAAPAISSDMDAAKRCCKKGSCRPCKIPRMTAIEKRDNTTTIAQDGDATSSAPATPSPDKNATKGRKCCSYNWCWNCKRSDTSLVEKREELSQTIEASFPAVPTLPAPDMDAAKGKKCCLWLWCWNCKRSESPAIEKREEAPAPSEDVGPTSSDMDTTKKKKCCFWDWCRSC